MPVVVMNSLSQAPLCTTLVSPVTIVDAGCPRRLRHRAGDLAQELDGHALLDDHRAGEIERPRAADGKIVDRAADGELADIAAGKHQRIDHEGIGGEGEPVAMRRR